MPSNTPKQTPFDDLVPGSRTPSSPSPSGPPPANNTLPLSGRTNAPATRVVARLQDDEPDDDDTAQATQTPPAAFTPRRRLPRKMLPTGTLVGLAMVGGAFIVLALSTLFMRVVPRAQTKSMPPPISTGPRIVESPAQDSDVLTPDEEADAARRTETGGSDETGNEVVRAPSGSSSSGTVVIKESPDDTADDTTTDSDTSTDNSRSDLRQSRSTQGTTTRVDRDDTDSRSTSRDRFEHSSTGYRIQPPSGFRLQKTGRRTVWSGPRGSQLLVETSNSPGRSPRADWEQLDKALAKKYGSRYRSHGISETTLAGRPAAVWEFEIGDTRKVDVAVHHRGKGYAVLAEAPVGDFESMRLQLESAIRSFELPARKRSSRSTSRTELQRESGSSKGDRDEDESTEGY